MRRIVPLVAAMTLAGCINSIDTSVSLPNTETDVAGRFALTNANGQGLPIVAQTTPLAQVSLVGDTMVITAAGGWTETATYHVDSLASVGSSTQTGVTTGTWTIANQQINFVTTGGGSASFNGALVRGTLTIAFNSGTFVYTKL